MLKSQQIPSPNKYLRRGKGSFKLHFKYHSSARNVLTGKQQGITYQQIFNINIHRKGSFKLHFKYHSSACNVLTGKQQGIMYQQIFNIIILPFLGLRILPSLCASCGIFCVR